MIFLVYGVYFGLAEGAEKALVADLVRPEQRGTAYGLYNLAFGITVLPASLLMGGLWDWRGAPSGLRRQRRHRHDLRAPARVLRAPGREAGGESRQRV